MSTFAQFRAAWQAWAAAALPTVPATWSYDPQPMVLKLPVRLELDGPHTIDSTADRDYRRYETADIDVQERITALRTAHMTIRAVSRDHVHAQAELTLERVRLALRRQDLVDVLRAADISIRRVGPSARYDTHFQGRDEATAALEIEIGWRVDDDAASGPDAGTIEHVELTSALDVDGTVTETTEILDR